MFCNYTAKLALDQSISATEIITQKFKWKENTPEDNELVLSKIM
jgi:hypothetical protein